MKIVTASKPRANEVVAMKVDPQQECMHESLTDLEWNLSDVFHLQARKYSPLDFQRAIEFLHKHFKRRHRAALRAAYVLVK